MTDTINSTCNNCGSPESNTPKKPGKGECDCRAVTEWCLADIYQGAKVKRAQAYQRALDVACCYPFLRLDVTTDAKAMEALETLATFLNKRLTTIGEDVPLPNPACNVCLDSGVIVDNGEPFACSCESGKDIYR